MQTGADVACRSQELSGSARCGRPRLPSHCVPVDRGLTRPLCCALSGLTTTLRHVAWRTKRDIISLTIEAPQIARKIVPGQFVVVRVNETGERVPFTVAYKDVAAGTITIIFQVVGKSTAMLASLCVRERPGAA